MVTLTFFISLKGPTAYRNTDFALLSHTLRSDFHYETYIGISQYRTVLYYMYTVMLYNAVGPTASERGMLLTERRRFTTLWSSVDCTLLCDVESFG